ncbi:phosphoenolpyruvate--protein phosphotransferase [Microbacterium sp. nov. GSS16]|uniref:phosphoenolpyruvate--protein phosphotransferase n=1 Tax=Microbacterium sp. nov. GSS16 TaxID=3019890 RepID=UPI00230549D7|nr:phosphoenolpyruvate--protein phosphotransferase [Microbacterium sp. nov. GSS16]WCD92712.1 phosphoenolpyruvate--protein phosphotransferase [Microbacterium sp. nov. GSS16]
MIGIVAVSHSARLGEAVLELALQMVHGDAPPVRVAAGAGSDGDGTPILGTDAMAVASAIDDLAAECDGVLVLMDLGSAVMSAELALELRSSEVPVRLAPAPFVEGLLAAVVAAAAGGALDTVAEEAAAALAGKTGQLQPDAPVEAAPEERVQDEAAPPGRESARITRRVRVRNPLGIHARPAALIAETSAGADVRLRRLPDGPDASAGSLSRLLMLGARGGDEIELSALDDQVLDALAALFENGFGEGVDDAPAGAGAAPDEPVSAAERSAPGAPAALASAAPAPTPPAPIPPARAVPAPGAPAAPAPAAPAPAAPAPLAAAPVPPGTTLRGRGVSAGVAAAPVVTLAPPVTEPDAAAVIAADGREAEVSRIDRACLAVAADLRSRAAAASGDGRDILEASALLASDPDLIADATALVRDAGRSAARAIWEVAAAQQEALEALGGRTAERAADVRDVRDRIVAEILGLASPGVPQCDEPFVLVARDLSPADTAALHGGRCVALVTEQGGPTSHTAIIARSLGLPAVVGVIGATGLSPDTTVLVDGDRGAVEVDPDPARIDAATRASAVTSFDGTGRLGDGSRLPLLANVGGAADAEIAAAAGAEGVGLFRTEFCFLDRADAPTVAEQVTAYRGVLSAFSGRKVVVRTLDAGSDKPVPFANADDEQNPALGVRGLRIARRTPQLLDDQLRALAEAASAESALVEVMAPMVATVDEARDFAARARGFGLERVGVMIETPSAALLAAELFEVVDFVSLGTNDLAQYTLAADRLLGELGDLNDPWQPAVLRLIGMVGSVGRAANRAVGVCGEAGGDPQLAPVLVGLGVTSLSMTPRSLGRVAAALAAVTPEQCRRAAGAASASATAAQARSAAAAALER